MRAWLLILLFPCLGAAQDSTVVSNEKLIKAAELIQEQRDSIKDLRNINGELKRQNNLQSVVIRRKDDEIRMLESKLDISGGIITDYSDHLKKDKRVKNSRIFYFIGGIATAYVSSLIVRNIIR